MLKNFKSFLIYVAFFLTAQAHAQPLSNLLHLPDDPIAGNPKGKITVVEFFDYQCSHCSLMVPIMDHIVKTNPNVRVVFKEYPIRGAMSLYATRAALAANKQGKYLRFSRALLYSRTLSESSILNIAKKVGLDVQQLIKDMNSSSVTNQIRTNVKLARELHVTGTPAFLIANTNAQDARNIDLVLGEMSRGELQSAINSKYTR